MIRIRNILFAALILAVVLLLPPVMNTCERFDPAGELYFYIDTITIQSRGTYVLNGALVNLGKEEVNQHGFCWSDSEDPTIETDSCTRLGIISSPGKFSSTVSGLIANKTYYVRAYASSDGGTEYSTEESFTTPAPTLPVLITAAISILSADSAQSGGIITDDGGSPVTARGVCWDTTANPTIDHNHTTDGIGIGSYISLMTGLQCGWQYFVRAYATNEAGTTYGNEFVFKIPDCAPGMPDVITTSINSITQTSAQGGGNVSNEGFSSVTVRGVCWSISSNPTVADNHTTDGSGSGVYTSSLTGLAPNTKYYVRAYATNTQGTSYGTDESFTTLTSDETVTDFDGNVYNTVQIGEQVWMRENLKVTHFPDGTEIPLIVSKFSWDALTVVDKAYCWYDNSIENRDNYGGLYTWAAAMNGSESSETNPSGIQGVCPTGWHLPSDGEWTEMTDYLGGSEVVGGKLKETGTTHWASPNIGATNESGFTALPGGAVNYDGDILSIDSHGFWWTSTEELDTSAWSRVLHFDNIDVFSGYGRKSNGFSVRCIKDDGSPTLPIISTSPVVNITDSSAQTGGNITSDGGAPVTVYGVCWSTTENPSLSYDYYTTEGIGTGSFSSSIIIFECNTTYYVRAYATNSVGTAYGNQVSFTSKQCAVVNLPAVVTSYLTNPTTNSTAGGGEVIDDGGGPVTARGICWSTSQSPTISDSHSSDGTGTGSYTSNVTGLTKSTTYYIRAYATNSAGTSYGEERILKTYEGTITDYDGNDYWTVVVGSQKWMAENLYVTHYANGTSIPPVEIQSDWSSLSVSDKAYCWYNNNSENKDIYGGLYTWAAAMNGANSSDINPSIVQGVCPSGWHLPSDSEWTELSDYLGGVNEAGGKLKESGTSFWSNPNFGATNESGFTAIPGGLRYLDGIFNGIGFVADFWTATMDVAGISWNRSLNTDGGNISRGTDFQEVGISVRCVEGQGYSVPTVTTTSFGNITDVSADGGGNVIADGGQGIIANGVCWGTDPNPTTEHFTSVDGGGLGAFSSSITGLRPFTTYYIRAYALNSVGTGYGEIDSIKTLWDNSTITDYDGNSYNTILIGDQVWMKENLKVTHYVDGTSIPIVQDASAWETLTETEKAYCWYDNSTSNRDIYGGLYTWAASMNGAGGSETSPSGVQGVCPDGWHIPSDEEWKELEMHLGMSQVEADTITWRGTDEGGKLKEAGTSHWISPNTGANNSSGFTGLPGGLRLHNGPFVSIGNEGAWWSSSESNIYNAWPRYLNFEQESINRTLTGKERGISVRCVLD